MFRPWACQTHSFLFNPLAARPLQQGRRKVKVVFIPLNRPVLFLLEKRRGRETADPRKGRGEASVLLPALLLLCCVSLGESFNSQSVQTQMLMLSVADVCLFIHKPVTRNLSQAGEHPDQGAAREPTAVAFSSRTSHAVTWICLIFTGSYGDGEPESSRMPAVLWGLP